MWGFAHAPCFSYCVRSKLQLKIDTRLNGIVLLVWGVSYTGKLSWRTPTCKRYLCLSRRCADYITIYRRNFSLVLIRARVRLAREDPSTLGQPDRSRRAASEALDRQAERSSCPRTPLCTVTPTRYFEFPILSLSVGFYALSVVAIPPLSGSSGNLLTHH